MKNNKSKLGMRAFLAHAADSLGLEQEFLTVNGLCNLITNASADEFYKAFAPIRQDLKDGTKPEHTALNELFVWFHREGQAIVTTAEKLAASTDIELDEELGLAGGPMRELTYRIQSLSNSLKKYTNDMASSGFWRMAAGESVPVFSVWTNRQGEAVSDPEERAVMKAEMPLRNAGMFILEDENGRMNPCPVISVSDGVYRPSGIKNALGVEDDARQNFMVKVVPTFCDLLSGGAGLDAAEHRIDALRRHMENMVEPLQAMSDVAELIHVLKPDAVDMQIYGLEEESVEPKVDLTAENNPEAKIEIGSFS